MLNGDRGLRWHETFKEHCALADTGSLSPEELSQLEAHLDTCQECRDLLREYRVLASEGMGALAAVYGPQEGRVDWNEAPSCECLMERIREHQATATAQLAKQELSVGRFRGGQWRSSARIGLAACLLLSIGYAGYLLGTTRHSHVANAPASPWITDEQVQKLSAEKGAAEGVLAAQSRKIIELERQTAEKEQELQKMRSAMQSVEDRANELALAKTQAQQQLQTLSQQRDLLAAEVQNTAGTIAKNRAELDKLHTERDGMTLRAASLEARIDELTATNREQERRVKDAEQYLISDRDIRELMGARKLYIADVFDVDGSSRTQKPFGRVFYTQGKSLIFYAFDLDRQTKILNASSFQVWGQREAPQGESASPMNLGILYLDNEANRRWVMRFDDPKQLSQIDAVFVTVEPSGGSQKPTSKPFLYALLRNEANHP